MKTRFDGKLWIGAFGLAIEVKDMETAHLLNTVKMLSLIHISRSPGSNWTAYTQNPHHRQILP